MARSELYRKWFSYKDGHLYWNKGAKPRTKVTTGFQGVGFHRQSGLYSAKIKLRGKYISIGYFKTCLEAANAYNEKAKELFGEFAHLNEVRL